MSRTFRRLRQRKGKHNQPSPESHGWWRRPERLLWDGQRTMRSTPSAWVRFMMTKPQRAEVRNKLQQLHRLADLEDAPEFPLAKKPHVYYW